MKKQWYRLTHKRIGGASDLLQLDEREVESFSNSYDIEPMVVGTKEEFDYELGKAYDAGFAAGRNYEDMEE